jgi:peptide/nickel transport system substrate-binding protein
VDNVSTSNVFKYNEAASISSLDPVFVKSQSENWICSQINAGLVQLDTQLNVTPMLADSWKIDKNTYTFYLNRNAFFHEWKDHKSRKVSAFDVKASFERLMDPETASPGTWVFSDKIKEDNPFKAIDSFTFEINLSQPFPPLLGLLTMPYCYIIPIEAAEYYGKDFRNNPVGCGPFVFKRWEENVGMVLTRFEKYFEKDLAGNQLPYLDAINISINPNKASAFMDFAAGKLDFFNEIEAGLKDEILTPYGQLTPSYQEKYLLKAAPFLNTEFLMFNMESENELIKNEKIRKAINYGINRNNIVNNVRNGLGFPGHSGFTPPSLLKQPTKGYQFNQQKAKRLILESGLDINNPLRLGITTDYLDMALFIKRDLELLGFNIKIEVHPGSFLRQLRNEKGIDFYRGSWIADYPDAENYLACFYSKNHYPSGPNYSRYTNNTYDEWYNNAMESRTESVRNNWMHQMDSLLIENPPFVVLYYDKSLRITKPSIQNLWSYPNNMLQLKYVRKAGKN